MEIIFFLITLSISFLITPSLIRLASRLSIVYDPRRGSIHSRAMPLLGGLSIYTAFLVATSLAFLFSRGKMLGEYDYHYLGIILGGSLMVALGIYDDARGVPFPIKLVVQVLAAFILIGCGYRITFITNPLGGEIAIGWWGGPILIIWLVGITNALSLINRIDGLACGVAAICGITLFFAALNGPPFVPVIALAIAAGCTGFLRYNFYPARIFLGSTGSLFLGFVLGAVAVQGSFKITAAITLTLPILAILTALFSRGRRICFKERQPRPKRQLHNRLLTLGYSPKQVVLILYLLQANLGIIALVMVKTAKELALAIFILVGSMLFILFRIMEDYRRRIQELELKNEGTKDGERMTKSE